MMNSPFLDSEREPPTLFFPPRWVRGDQLLLAQKQALEMIVRGSALRDVLSFLTQIVEQCSEERAVASILLLDAEGCLRVGAAPSLPDFYNAAIDGLKARTDLGTCSVAAVTGDVVITPDIAADPKWETIKHLPLGIGLRAAWSQPIIDGNGRVLGTFGTYFRECRVPTDIERQLVGVLSHTAALAIERKSAEDQKDQQRRVLDMALEAAGMGTWRYTLADNICLCSPRAVELYGLAGPHWLHDEAGVLEVLHPDDVPGMWADVGTACDPLGDGRYSAEYRVKTKDGGWRWLSVWGVVEFEEQKGARRPVALTGASRDITDRKQGEERQKLLIDELNHRVKNTLAIIQSISQLTLRNAADPAAFGEAFSARLSALSRAHSLLTNLLWQEVSFSEIVDTTLAPFSVEREDRRIRFEGPRVMVPANSAVTLSLMLHELATNAAKHGALSSPYGRLDLCLRAETNGRCGLKFIWQERDGPAVTPPTRKGLGSRLIAASVEQLGGEAQIDFRPEGLRCAFTFRTDRT